MRSDPPVASPTLPRAANAPAFPEYTIRHKPRLSLPTFYRPVDVTVLVEVVVEVADEDEGVNVGAGVGAVGAGTGGGGRLCGGSVVILAVDGAVL